MSRRYTRRGTALLLVLALLVSMLGAALPVMQKSGAASGAFATAYTALLEKAPVAQADLERDPYGLCRLVVTGYGGKDYGAVAAAVTDGLAILQYDTPLAARKAAVQLAQDGATAEPDSLCQLETDTDLTGNLCPWAGEMVGTTAFCARRQIPSHRVVIAQIDTGFMLDHPALQGRLVSDGIDLSGDGRANAAYDTRQRGATYWHATAVASVLAGNTDENVKILPYKVVRFGTDTCAASAVLAAMEDAVAKGARVLNMSLSTSQNRAGFAAMMDKAAALGVAVCCSAGNAGEQISNRYPSALPQAITVSAVTADKTVAGFSNYGDLVDYCAPGSHITVATMDSGGAPAATTASGTSLSCPYGAACCALLLSLHPDLTLDQLNALLQGSAEDLGDPGFDPIYGNGLLRLDNLTRTGTTGNLTYTLTLPEGTLVLTGTGDGADYDCAAATPWALWAEELQQITMADTVTGLGNFTFSGCQSAVFTLPETLQRLGAYVFENCKGLHNITLPRNVVQVGTGAFSGSSDLTVRGWRNTPAPRAAAAAGAAFLPLGCVHNYVCQILRPTDTDPGSLTYTCALGCLCGYGEQRVHRPGRHRCNRLRLCGYAAGDGVLCHRRLLYGGRGRAVQWGRHGADLLPRWSGGYGLYDSGWGDCRVCGGVSVCLAAATGGERLCRSDRYGRRLAVRQKRAHPVDGVASVPSRYPCAAPGGADRRRRILTESYLAYGVRHGRRVRGAPRTGDCLF